MKSYNTIAERIEILQSRIEAYKDEIEVLKAEPKSDNERIIFKFGLGIKSSRDSLYSSGDVTKLIKDGATDISPALLEIARVLASARNKNGPSC